MAKRKKRRAKRANKKQDYPGWAWMIFGLAIGLSVAFAVYVKDRGPASIAPTPEPASLQGALDDNDEPGAPAVADPEEPKERRFTFYELLPAFEMEVRDASPEVEADIAPQAVVEPGTYVLQAGSFSTPADADRRRAELGLQGIESRVQPVRVNSRDFYRVYIGPTDDLDELNMLRSRLRAAQIDVLRIRLGD